ncbi:NosD domain-containing protein [Methanolobus sp.]|uniref:NosD domain-containing protein n=1 Tax=Methanolobus sp. TaxID=1874737 RepID=UPI0025EB4A17|nr:NosD domain-containing protein [Methanolobus sp.]
MILCLSTGIVSSADIIVGSGLGNTTINAALFNASNGDIIIVSDGNYTENIVVSKNVTIRSQNGSTHTTIEAASPDIHVFNITADSVAIQGLNVIGPTNYSSIYMLSVSDCNISDNVISESYAGIFCFNVSNSDLINNTITSSVQGIYLYDSPNNTLINNTMESNEYNFGGYGTSQENFFQNIDTSNLVDGKPIYYLIDQADMQVPSDAGQVYVVNSTNVTVKDIAISNGSEGIVFAYTDNSKIENVTLSENEYGIVLFNSNSNILDNINVNNNYYGIFLRNSTNNNLISNIISSNGWDGISLYSSSELNNVNNNTISSNGCDGIYLDYSGNNTLSNNTIINNPEIGINLYESADNNIINNSVNNNTYQGIYLEDSTNNTLIDNIMESNGYNFGVGGATFEFFVQNIDASNTIDGKVLYYLLDQADMQVPSDAGQVYAVNSTNITVNDIEVSNSFDGVVFVSTDNSTIENVTVSECRYGIYLLNSSSNALDNIRSNDNLIGVMNLRSNNITLSNSNMNSNFVGIHLQETNNSVMANLNANDNIFLGIGIIHSNNNCLSETAANNANYAGIYLSASDTNTLTNNIASSNQMAGILIFDSDNNDLAGNTFDDNKASSGDLSSVNLESESLTNDQTIEQAFFDELNSLIAAESENMVNSISINSVSGARGIYISGSTSNTFSNTHSTGNDHAFYAFDSVNTIVNNLMINTDMAQMSFVTSDAKLVISEENLDSITMPGKTNVNGYVNMIRSPNYLDSIVLTPIDAGIDIQFFYDDSGMSSAGESSIDLFRLNDTVWEEVPNATLNTSSNYVSATINENDGVAPAGIMGESPTYTVILALFKDEETTRSNSGSAAQRERREGTITDLQVGNDGKVTSDMVVKSADATTTLTLYQGTRAVDTSGYPVNKIIVTTPLFLPADTPGEVIESGLYFRFGPSGTTFSQEVMITMDFDPELFEGRAPVIYTYTSEEGWIALETTVDWENGRATAMISHFSLYALFGTDSEETQDIIAETQGTDIVSPATQEEGAPAESEGGFGHLYWIVGVVIVLGMGIVVVTKQKNKEGEL